MPPRSLRSLGHEERVASRITALRGDGKPQKEARAVAKEEGKEDIATAAGPVNPKKAWPGVAKKVKATTEAYEKGGEGRPPVHIQRLLEGVVPDVAMLLGSDPVAWTPPQAQQAAKCIIILVRADPKFIDGCCEEMDAEGGEKPEGETPPEADGESEAED